jgi:hypothetical protein
MQDLHPIGDTRGQEPNHLHVHDRYLREIENTSGPVILELLVQFPDVLRLKVTTQENRGRSALRSLFDLHVGATSIEAPASLLMQALCQRANPWN